MESIGHNSQEKAIIRNARIARRKAHAASASSRMMRSNPLYQSIRNKIRIQTRAVNLATAIVMGRSIDQVETAPKDPKKVLEYTAKLMAMNDHVVKAMASFVVDLNINLRK